MTVYMKKVCLFLAGAFLVVNMLLIYLNVHESNSLYVVSEEMIDDAVAFIRSKGVDITESVIPDKIPNNSVYTFSYRNDELAQKIADNLSKQYFSSDASLSFVETPDGFTYSITDKSANSGVLKLYSDSFRFGYNENLFSEIPSVQFSQLPFKNDNTELDNDQIDALETFLTCLSADKKKVCYTVLGVNFSEDQSVVCVSQNVYDDFEISNMYVNAVIENGKVVCAVGSYIFDSLKKSYRQPLSDGINSLRSLQLEDVKKIISQRIVYSYRAADSGSYYLIPVWEIIYTAQSGETVTKYVDAIKS